MTVKYKRTQLTKLDTDDPGSDLYDHVSNLHRLTLKDCNLLKPLNIGLSLFVHNRNVLKTFPLKIN